MPKAALYARYSSDLQNPQSINDQVRECRQYAARKGWCVAQIYDDEAISGAEVIHRRGPWRCFEAVEYAPLEWGDWFNNRRLLEPIGNVLPAEAEANFYAALDAEPMAA